MKKKILVIEDDITLNRLLSRLIKQMGHDVSGVRSWKEANAYLEQFEPQLIITDVRLPDGDSLSRLPELIDNQPVIVLTAYGSVRNAVDAMKAGAYEYLVKPISPEEFSLVVERALNDADLRSDHRFCKERLLAMDHATSIMVGESEALTNLRKEIEDVADSDMTVLVHGESGSGKELVAKALHTGSIRSDHNFVVVDCCTFQENLFESELFGHERGAFTGADRQKKGLIEGAAGGTLFLDEIGEIAPVIQAKLLRVLETGTFRRLGGTKDLNANVRIVAATNRDLTEMTESGDFRQDLYYRLSAFTIVVPPLRERREDIPHIAAHFLQHHNFSRRISKSFAPAATRRLVAYDWPGNVRELKNVVERAIILSRDSKQIRPEHFAFAHTGTQSDALINLSFDHDPTLEELESQYLALQLKKYSGRRAKVAEVMGISERSIYRMIKRYELGEEA